MLITPLTKKKTNQLSELQAERWESIITRYKFYTNSYFCFLIKNVANNKIIGIAKNNHS